MSEIEKIWLLFDGRYRHDEDAATCLDTCYSLKEAKSVVDDYGTDTVIVEGDLVGDEIINLKIVN